MFVKQPAREGYFFLLVGNLDMAEDGGSSDIITVFVENGSLEEGS